MIKESTKQHFEEMKEALQSAMEELSAEEVVMVVTEETETEIRDQEKNKRGKW